VEPLIEFLNKQEVKKMAQEIEKEDSIFADKSELDTLVHPTTIIGREDKIQELLRFLTGYKKGHVAPLLWVYGRSGSGKSTIVRLVCESLCERDNSKADLSYEFVNLRKVKTIFGCTNLILAELGKPQVKSAQGMNLAISEITVEIEKRMKKEKSKLFVLVLDEFDVILNDEHASPSDFVFKLLEMHQGLKEKGYLTTIIAISNNLMSIDGFDDRVRSRIGISEIYFEPYTYDEIVKLLNDRASKAFSETVPSVLLLNIARISSEEHGDARRAIDLLRSAAETASRKGAGQISTSHVIEALQERKKDRVTIFLSTASWHLKAVCAALAKLTYLAESELSWHTTSVIFSQYEVVLVELAEAEEKEEKKSDVELLVSWATLVTTPLTHGRVSDLLIELKNAGLVEGKTTSQGRGGRTSQFRMTERPEVFGKTISESWWSKVEAARPDDEPNEFWEKRFGTKKGGR
jgi:cell division control protein 6